MIFNLYFVYCSIIIITTNLSIYIWYWLLNVHDTLKYTYHTQGHYDNILLQIINYRLHCNWYLNIFLQNRIFFDGKDLFNHGDVYFRMTDDIFSQRHVSKIPLHSQLHLRYEKYLITLSLKHKKHYNLLANTDFVFRYIGFVYKCFRNLAKI